MHHACSTAARELGGQGSHLRDAWAILQLAVDGSLMQQVLRAEITRFQFDGHGLLAVLQPTQVDLAKGPARDAFDQLCLAVIIAHPHFLRLHALKQSPFLLLEAMIAAEVDATVLGRVPLQIH